MNKRILFISGFLCHGHVTLDIAIAKEILSHPRDVDIRWLAAFRARLLLEKRGKALLPIASGYHGENQIAEPAVHSFKLSQFKHSVAIQRRLQRNIDLGIRVTTKVRHDFPAGDKTYDLMTAF